MQEVLILWVLHWPVIFGFALFGSARSEAVVDIGIENLKMPFIILSILLLALAAFLAYSKLPSPKNEEGPKRVWEPCNILN